VFVVCVTVLMYVQSSSRAYPHVQYVRGAHTPLENDDVHAQAVTLRQVDPQVAELPVAGREDPVARRTGVDERRFPPASARRGEDERLSRRRLEHLAEIAEQPCGELGERGGAVVLHRA